MQLSCKYLIVGGGMTADAAVHGIREVDRTGNVTMLSAESHPPYDRPPLSKKLWTGKSLDSIWRKTEAAGVDLHLDTRAVQGNPASHTVSDSRGNAYTYEKLLLATGGIPRHLPFADEGVIYFRTVDDYRQVRALADHKAQFIVIGGGFIGSEIAAALATNGCAVSMIFPGAGIGDRIYPSALSTFLNSYFREKGVTLLPGETVAAVERSEKHMTVRTGSGSILSADAVIAGIGIEPEVDLARSLGLTVDNGIVVDEFLRTSDPDIYAAGDVASFYSPALEQRRRVEHEDNANTMGAMAGRNMAGREEKYDYLPYFYSDLFDLGYEAVGELGNNMDVLEDWKEPFRKGVVYYLKNEKVRGVLLWDTWGQIDAARHLIDTQERLTLQTVKGRIVD
jgi:3-phenylpropionate/trans-cinnamate dioxygenase ferredoxin reductase component